MAEDSAAAPAAASAPAHSTLAEELAAAAAAVAGAEQAVQAEQSQAGSASANVGSAIAALIRNGLSNGPIAQSAATWDHLNTRLPEIVAAIIKEL
jgi:hypothetical protein